MLNIILMPYDDKEVKELLNNNLRQALKNEGMAASILVVDKCTMLGGILDGVKNEKNVLVLADLHNASWLDSDENHLSLLKKTPIIVVSDSAYALAYLDTLFSNLEAKDLIAIDVAVQESPEELQAFMYAYKIAARDKDGFVTSEAYRRALDKCGCTADFIAPKAKAPSAPGKKGPQPNHG